MGYTASYPEAPQFPPAPDFLGAVCGEELATIDEVKAKLRVDFDLDEVEINAIQIASRLFLEKQINRIIVDRKEQKTDLSSGERETAKALILQYAFALYHATELPTLFKPLLNSITVKKRFA